MKALLTTLALLLAFPAFAHCPSDPPLDQDGPINDKDPVDQDTVDPVDPPSKPPLDDGRG